MADDTHAQSAEVRISLIQLRAAVRSALQRQGYSGVELETILEVLMYAQLRGNNQGVVKLIGRGMPRSASSLAPKMVAESPTTGLVDGRQSHGMVTLRYATDVVCKKALRAGCAIVGTRNTSSSSGALGFYADRLASYGLLCLIFATSPPIVAPHGGTTAVFGTNPIAIGVPLGETQSPLVVDLATSAMAFYGLVEHVAAAKLIPQDVGFDKNGQPTTDPKRILEGGSLRPFDRGPKGSALSLMVSILGGALVSADTPTSGSTMTDWGHLVIAVDPRRFEAGPVDGVADGDKLPLFSERVETLLGRVRASGRSVRLPGDNSRKQREEAETSNSVLMERQLWLSLLRAAGEQAKL